MPNVGYFYAYLWIKSMGRLFPFVPTFFSKGCVLFFEEADCSLLAPCYRLNLIKLALDGNKFVDCAVVANEKFIVTENRHFDSVKCWYTLLYIADIAFISALTP